jgi:uncharacterized membrane-anchored protein YhcB (DUF1043 family)
VEQTLTAWLLPILALIVGIAIGFLITRLLPSAAPGRTQRQLETMQERFEAYQSEVVTHFNTTANLVRKLTQSYQDVQDHLASGADRLALDEVTRQRLQDALHAQPGTEKRERLTPPHDYQPPKDYAPKSGDGLGMLDESYGLKKEP